MTEAVTFKASAAVGLDEVANALAENPVAMGALIAAVAAKVDEKRRFEWADYWFEALADCPHYSFQFLAAGVVGDLLKNQAGKPVKKPTA